MIELEGDDDDDEEDEDEEGGGERECSLAGLPKQAGRVMGIAEDDHPAVSTVFDAAAALTSFIREREREREREELH